jgi:hypothetical protein
MKFRSYFLGSTIIEGLKFKTSFNLLINYKRWIIPNPISSAKETARRQRMNPYFLLETNNLLL